MFSTQNGMAIDKHVQTRLAQNVSHEDFSIQAWRDNRGLFELLRGHTQGILDPPGHASLICARRAA
jgi:hypothetical protein